MLIQTPYGKRDERHCELLCKVKDNELDRAYREQVRAPRHYQSCSIRISFGWKLHMPELMFSILDGAQSDSTVGLAQTDIRSNIHGLSAAAAHFAIHQDLASILALTVC
jgi:hypothetical protein